MTRINAKSFNSFDANAKQAIKMPERKGDLLIPFVKKNDIDSAITMPARITDQLLPLTK